MIKLSEFASLLIGLGAGVGGSHWVSAHLVLADALAIGSGAMAIGFAIRLFQQRSNTRSGSRA